MQKRHIIGLALAFTILPSCNPPAGETWVVLSRHSKTAEVTWIPTAPQVIAAREAARRFLTDRLSHLGTSEADHYDAHEIRDILNRFDSYRLQACGQTQNGHQVIRLNFLIPGPNDLRWRNDELYRVLDGGSAYWRAEYDPEKDAVISWDKNGYA